MFFFFLCTLGGTVLSVLLPGAIVRTNCYLWRTLISVYLQFWLNFKPLLLVLNRNLQIDRRFANIRQTKYLEPNLPECCLQFLSLRPLSFLECRALVTSGLPYRFRGFPGIHATVLPRELWRHQSCDPGDGGVFGANSWQLGGSGHKHDKWKMSNEENR